MGLEKRSHVRGMNHQLIVRGILSYPTAKIGEEVADAVADNFEDEEIPEESPEDGLSEEQAASIIDQLAAVADAISEKTGGARDFGVNKQAASVSLQDAAYAHAVALVKRAMEEGTTNPGEGTVTPELTGAEAQVDAVNNPSSAVVVPQGSSSIDTTPGIVGHAEPAAQQPGASASPAPDSMADVKAASELLRALKKLSEDGVLPSEGGRMDLNTNSNITTPVVAQGTTNSTTPTEPVPQKPHPATAEAGLNTTGSAPADVAKVAAFLQTPEGVAFYRRFQAQNKVAAVVNR
jgi:hypothetical protein